MFFNAFEIFKAELQFGGIQEQLNNWNFSSLNNSHQSAIGCFLLIAE